MYASRRRTRMTGSSTTSCARTAACQLTSRRSGRTSSARCGPVDGSPTSAAVRGEMRRIFVPSVWRSSAWTRPRQMVLRAHDVGVPVAQGDIRMIPVRPASLDGIWSAASLLHVPRAEVPRTLDAWRSCLRAAGVLGLSTSLGDDEGWEVCPYDPLTQPSGAPLRRWFVHHDRVGLWRCSKRRASTC